MQTPCLGFADPERGVSDLTVQIGSLDSVAVYNTELSYSCSGQISRRWTSQATRADNEDSGVFEQELA